MELFEILTARRRAIGMSIDELVEASRVPKGTVAKVMAGITRDPGIETLKAIAYAMGLSLEDLDDKKDSSPWRVLTPDEAELLTVYRDLNATGQGTLMNVARGLASNPDMKRGSMSGSVTA